MIFIQIKSRLDVHGNQFCKSNQLTNYFESITNKNWTYPDKSFFTSFELEFIL